MKKMYVFVAIALIAIATIAVVTKINKNQNNPMNIAIGSAIDSDSDGFPAAPLLWSTDSDLRPSRLESFVFEQSLTIWESAYITIPSKIRGWFNKPSDGFITALDNATLGVTRIYPCKPGEGGCGQSYVVLPYPNSEK